MVGLQVLRDLDQKVAALLGPSSTCTSKLQTPPLVSVGAPYQKPQMSEDNFRREKEIGSGSEIVA
jgi:hypothetical protein